MTALTNAGLVGAADGRDRLATPALVVDLDAFDVNIAMLADVCLVSEFAVCNLTAGLEMQRLVSIDNTYSSSTYCFWRNGKSRSQRLRRVYWTRTVASLAPTKKKDDGCTILCDLVPFTL